MLQSHRPRRRRALASNEVRVEKYDGTCAYIRRSVHGTHADFCEQRAEKGRTLRQLEDKASANRLPGLLALVREAALLFPRNAPSARVLSMYLACTVWGWQTARAARGFKCHRTLVSKYVRLVEDWRDEPNFNDRMTELENLLQ